MKEKSNKSLQKFWLLVSLLAIVVFSFYNITIIKKYNALKLENKNYIEFTKNLFLKFSDNLNLHIDENLFIFNNGLDSFKLSTFVDNSRIYVYLDESQCSTCIVKLKEFNNLNLVYLVSYDHERWRKWLESNVLVDQNVYYLKNPLIDNMQSRSPLFLKFEGPIITKIAPLNETTSKLGIFFFTNTSN